MRAEKENPPGVECLAAETQGGFGGAAGLPAKIARYSEARRKALQMRSFAEGAGHVKEAAKLAGCANYLLFRHYYTRDEVRLHAAQFCKKHLLCPMCAIRRGAKMLKAYLERYDVTRTAHPHLRPYLVTVTVKNGEDLGERLRHLRSAMRRMSEARRRYLSNPQAYRFVEFARSQGGFHSIEVTNKGNGWHPHAHMIWLCAEEPSQQRLSEEWAEWTLDSFVVDVRPLHDPVDGFLEVCKYAVKFSELAPADNWHAYEVMSGQRLIDAHGLMRGVEIPDELTDEPLDGLPYVDLLYRYFEGKGYGFVPGAGTARGNGFPGGAGFAPPGERIPPEEPPPLPLRGNEKAPTRGTALPGERALPSPGRTAPPAQAAKNLSRSVRGNASGDAQRPSPVPTPG